MVLLEGFVWKQKRATALMPGLVKRFLIFDSEDLSIGYSRTALESPPRFLTLVLEDAEDLAPVKLRSVPCTKLGLRGLGGRRVYGIKVRTAHRNLSVFFESMAEALRWRDTINDALEDSMKDWRDTRRGGVLKEGDGSTNLLERSISTRSSSAKSPLEHLSASGLPRDSMLKNSSSRKSTRKSTRKSEATDKVHPFPEDGEEFRPSRPKSPEAKDQEAEPASTWAEPSADAPVSQRKSETSVVADV